MNDDQSIDRYRRSLELACNEPPSLEEACEFEEAVANDRELLRQFMEEMQFQADLHLLLRSRRNTATVLAQVNSLEASSPESTASYARPDEPSDQRSPAILLKLFHAIRKRDFVLSRAAAILLAASALVVTLLLAGWPIWRDLPEPVAGGSSPMNSEKILAEAQELDRGVLEGYVARIVRVSPDLVWNQPTVPLDFLLRIKQGGKLSVAKGLVQMEFASGANIILHGPAVFTPTSSTTGHLESGRLTGSAAEGNFHLTTPAADVIDLGTEFGVVADADRGSDVVVFDGRVQVVSRGVGSGAKQVLDMTEGMAARFGLDGKTDYNLYANLSEFERDMAPPISPMGRDEICLIDILAGGDGFGDRLASAIDPTNGKKCFRDDTSKPSRRASDGIYHPVDWQPLIDGVFVPTQNGLNVQIDTAGHKVDLPPGSGRTWKLIWARSKHSVLETQDADFWGAKTLDGIVEKLAEVRRGIVGIHASVGFTLDLQAVRLRHHRSPLALEGRSLNSDNSAVQLNGQSPSIKRTADLRVFVDGQLRYSRLGFRREDGEEEFVVPLESSDRFLTIISGDDGNYLWDQVLLLDPVIKFPKTSPAPEETAAHVMTIDSLDIH